MTKALKLLMDVTTVVVCIRTIQASIVLTQALDATMELGRPKEALLVVMIYKLTAKLTHPILELPLKILEIVMPMVNIVITIISNIPKGQGFA